MSARRSSGKGSSGRNHIYYSDSSEDESDRARQENAKMLESKRARSVRTLLMDASARGLIDYQEDACNPPMRPLATLEKDLLRTARIPHRKFLIVGQGLFSSLLVHLTA